MPKAMEEDLGNILVEEEEEVEVEDPEEEDPEEGPVAGFQKGAERLFKKKCGSKKERKRLKAKRKRIQAFGKEEKDKKEEKKQRN